MQKHQYCILLEIDEKRAPFFANVTTPLLVWRSISEVLVTHHYMTAQAAQGLYLAPPGGGPVELILAAQDLARRRSWLQHVLRSMKLIRLDETTDLRPALAWAGVETPSAGAGR